MSMSPLSAALFTGAVACGYFGCLYLRAYRRARLTMYEHLMPDRTQGGSALQRFEGWFAETGTGQACAAYLAKSGLPLSPLKYAAVLVACSGVLYLFFARFLGLHGLTSISLVTIAVPLLTRGYLHLRRQQFLKDLQLQLPEVAMMASNALKAGYSLTQVLSFVSEQARVPVRDIFRHCRDQVELGRPVEDALTELIGRYDSPDLRLMLATMLLQKQSGGNLVAALEQIARTIRRRQETLGEVRATLAQAQQTVRVLPFLPLLCALMFNVAMPGFLNPLFTPVGLVVLAVVIMLQVGAAVIIRHVSRIEV